MKTKARNSLIATSLACVALSSALCMTGGEHSASAEKYQAELNESLVACQQALKTVRKDLESIVNGYNNVYNSDWTASAIEYTSTVFLLDENEYGIYVDLDGDNGYFIMTPDNKLYGVHTSGDLDYLRGIKNLCYHSADGFLYVDGNGDYQKFPQTEILYNTDLPYSTTAATGSSTVYPGQQVAGDGKIDSNKINEYVSARYPGFTLKEMNNNISVDFDYTTQVDTSYYVKLYSNGNKDPENNCYLTAMYNLLKDWSKRGDIKNVPYTETYDMNELIKDDIFYDKYGTGTKTGSNNNGSYKWTKNEKLLPNVPKLYNNIRGYAIRNGYDVEAGYSLAKVPATIEYVMNTLYGNTMKIKEAPSLSYVTSSIKADQACYVSINNSSSYGNHGAAVVGYYKFKKETIINDYQTVTDYIYFYEIADGGYTTSKIFDPNVTAKSTTTFYYLSRC
ncbi:MAG: hypothetical protein K2M47_07740 [Clostridiales bacterium]|nr:hypothetical protein [Clostridiales bacterium]